METMMNDLVVQETAGSVALPKTSRLDALDQRVSDVAEFFYRNIPGSKLHGLSGEMTLRKMDETIAQTPALLADLEKARRPATKGEIAVRTAALLKSVPYDGGKGDSVFFGRQAAEDVGAQHPSIAALILAYRNLRWREDFIPTIAKIIAEIKACEDKLSGCAFHLEILPSHRAEVAREIAVP